MSANPPDLEWEEKKVLIIGRASPEPGKKHFETVCTGGISEDGHLLRLYPIPLRYLEEEKHYRLWSWVKFDIQKNQSDRRKESYKIRQDTITILSQVQSEAEQFSLLRKALFPDREKLDELYHRDWTSLGVIEIEVIELATREAEKNWAVQKPYINQFDLFIERKPLDRSPFDLRLRFRCKNNPNCKSHVSTLIGWEYLEAFRKFKQKYGSGESAFEKLREAFWKRFCNPGKNLYALVGTHHIYGSWMVAQLYAFDRNLPATLF